MQVEKKTHADLASGAMESSSEANAPIAPAPARSASDTTPSFVIPGNQPADTSIAPGQPHTAPGDPGATRTAEKVLPFVRLGHYEIVRKIGHGGMGDVYLAYEPALDRKVAIKVLPADLARRDDFVTRFQAEATAAARLIHPNIIQIYFIGAVEEHRFFAMQYVEGESLADLLQRREKLGVEETLAIVEQALLGLSAAHELGMVHRDIKPGNILLDTRRRRALLADFGLVKSLEPSATGQTATGVVMGTADYISPEQGRGQAVDGRSDLYSIGVLLYRMLSGRLPFTADNPTALIFQHVYEPPPALGDTAPDVPAALARVVARLLAKTPGDRHQTADDVLVDLRAFRLGQTLPESGAAPGERRTTVVRLMDFDQSDLPLPAGLTDQVSAKWWDRTKDRALSLFRRHAPEILQQLQNTQQQVDSAVAVYERRQRDLGRLVQEAESVLAEMQQQVLAQRAAAVSAAAHSAATAVPAAAEAARQQQADCEQAAAVLEQQAANQQEEIDSIKIRLAQVTTTLRQLSCQRDVLKARLKTAQAGQRVAYPSNTIAKVPWSALVISVAVVSTLALIIVPQDQVSIAIPTPPGNPRDTVESASPWKTLSGHRAPVWCLALTADGNRAFSGSGEAGKPTDNSIRVWDMKTGKELASLTGHSDRILSVSISADGKRILSGCQDSTVFLWDAATATKVQSFGAHSGQIVEFAPDGEHALFAGGGILSWRDLSHPEKSRSFALGNDLVWCVAIEKDCRRALTSGGMVNTFRLWDVPSGRAIRLFEGHGGWVEGVAFVPGGQYVISTSHDATIRLWKIDGGAPVRTYRGHDGAVLSVAVSHDGRRVLSGGTDGTVRLWDLDTGTELARGRGHAGQVRAVEFAPDGLTAVSGGTDATVRIWKFKA